MKVTAHNAAIDESQAQELQQLIGDGMSYADDEIDGPAVIPAELADRIAAASTAPDEAPVPSWEEALQAVFEDIRTQSADSQLVTPDRWTEIELIPNGMTSQEFVDAVFAYLADPTQATLQQYEPQPEPADGEGAAAADEATAHPESSVASAPAQPQDEAKEADQPDSAETPTLEEDCPIACADIVFLEGAETMYLYSSDFMTANYANWCFLAKEDNAVTTLVQCTREESRVYPRPMIYDSLENPPFNLTEDQILDAWKAVEESGLYPDIKSCNASNDDVYFYSTDYLSEAQAKALAEWYSVERPLHL